MTKRITSKLYVALLISLMIMVAAPYAFANHSWGGYHWERGVNPLQLELGDNVAGEWDASLALSASDWSQSAVLDLSVVPGNTDGLNCQPTKGRVEVCNANYGDNGWLGIAQIWVSRKGKHITQGLAKMNDHYFASPQFNTAAWRNMVMCQETAHTFGLDHQDEDFYNANLGTCMDYTVDPSTNQHPNNHDYEQLLEIYAHLDGQKKGGGPGGGNGNGKGPGGGRGNAADVSAKVDLNDPSAWGEAVSFDAQGRAAEYVRVDGDSLVVTHVLWADSD